mgnify:CR=1 FL=1
MKKSYTRISMAALAVLAASVSVTGCGSSKSSADKDNELYVYNWGEYIDESVISQFEEETGIKVIYDMFETNEEMYPIIEAGAISYDAVCPSDYMIQKMVQNDLLAELNFDNIPNIKEIDPLYLQMASTAFDPENKYAVPYTWGDLGILYNDKRLEELGIDPPTKWSDLWDERLSGELLMQDSIRSAFTIALTKNGYSLNTTNPDEIAIAKNDLIAQKPLVQAYVIDQVRDKMIGGEAAVGVIYSGEMLYIQGEDGTDNLEYVIPEEGTDLFIDCWVIPKNAKNKENAEKWINFLCRPDIAKKNFEYITYSTPNKGAFELLDEDMQNNKAVFPDIDSIKNAEVLKYLGDDVDELYNEAWKEVKSK